MYRYLLTLALLLPQASIAEESYRVVFHINEASKLVHLNNNIRNIKKSMKDNVKIVVVFNGRSVTRLTNSSGTQKIINEMKNNGAELLACSSSLVKNKISEDHLIKGVTYLVEGGITKLVELQKQGYSYIKP